MDVVLSRLLEKIVQYLSLNEFSHRHVQKGNEVNIEFEYPETLKSELGGLLPIVIIELVPRANEIPNEDRTVTPIIYEVLADILDEGSFQVSTLAPERTFFWKKLLFIHETVGGFKKGSERKSRHFYDLLKLYRTGVFDRIKDNRELLQMVVKHRQTFFRYNTLDYLGILKNGVNVVPLKEIWADWRSDYSRTIVMFYNDIPSFDDLMPLAAHLEKEFNNWVSNK